MQDELIDEEQAEQAKLNRRGRWTSADCSFLPEDILMASKLQKALNNKHPKPYTSPGPSSALGLTYDSGLPASPTPQQTKKELGLMTRFLTLRES